MALVFPGVVRGVGDDPVDRQEGAVQDHKLLHPNGLHRLGQGRGEGGQDFDDLAYVVVDRRDADAEPGGELGIGIAAPQVSQGGQGLSACGQTPPARSVLSPPGMQPSTQIAQGAAGQINRRRVDKHAKLLVGHGGSWSWTPPTRSFIALQSRPSDGHRRQVGNSSLHRPPAAAGFVTAPRWARARLVMQISAARQSSRKITRILLLRYFWDEPFTQLAVNFVGGEGRHTVLRREPMRHPVAVTHRCGHRSP